MSTTLVAAPAPGDGYGTVDLVRQARGGDQRAFGRLVERTLADLRAAASSIRRRAGVGVTTVLHDGLSAMILKRALHYGEVNDRASFVRAFRVVAFQEQADQGRQQRAGDRRIQGLAGLGGVKPPERPSPLDEMIEAENAAYRRRAAAVLKNRLPALCARWPVEAAAFFAVLERDEGESVRAVARRMGISEATLRTRAQRFADSAAGELRRFGC